MDDQETTTGLARDVERVALIAWRMLVVVICLCLAALFIAGTYGVIHPGDDFSFGDGSHGGGD